MLINIRWVKRAVLAVYQSLPVLSDKRTFPAFVGMFQSATSELLHRSNNVSIHEYG